MRWIILLLLLASTKSFAIDTRYNEIIVVFDDAEQRIDNTLPPNTIIHKLQIKFREKGENKRWVAAALTITLGPFGVHRLYLGTHYRVPVIYSLTFGCFFILPIIDLGVILFTKDLEKYQNNPRLIMWMGNTSIEKNE
jgi:TM2 domain-containing membrane protein YozV